jgi:ElaB/YqjD/DUF883 family membrane-anchored ribosome-binding protein
MDSTLSQSANQARATASRAASDLANGARSAQDAGAHEFENLVADVEELVTRVADVTDPEIARIRTKVKDALVSAREAISSSADSVTRQARQVAGGTVQYVRGNPWQAVGLAAMVGITVGYFASRRA